MSNAGKCVGGPLDGRYLDGYSKRVTVPIYAGPDRGEGDHGFGAVYYVWHEESKTWRYEASAPGR